MKHPPKVQARKRQRQEGAALLIVLFVLLMATTTAVFSLSSTQFEVRAAGSLRQSMRAKFISEAATNGIIAVCYQLTTSGCTDNKIDTGNLDSTTRQIYGLPNWGSETVYRIAASEYSGTAFTDLMLPNDTAVSGMSSGSGGIAGQWTPDAVSTMEKSMTSPGNPNTNTPATYRLVVSTYGSLNTTAADVKQTDELRLAHSTISTTRAFIDL